MDNLKGDACAPFAHNMAIPYPASEVLYQYWGKARRAETGGRICHLLAYHCLDVAAVADAWWRADGALRGAMARSSGLAEEPLGAILRFFCALHDLGKWDVRFQGKVPEIAASLHPRGGECLQAPYDHGQGGYAAFVRANGDLPENAYRWMQAVAGHHGSLPADAEWRAPTASPEVRSRDDEARKSWIGFLDQLFLKPAGASLAELPSPPSHLAGFCCLSDWLGSNEDYFPYEGGRRDLGEYFMSRAGEARRCLEASGLVKVAAAPGGMAGVFPSLTPRGVQSLVEGLPLAPGLTLIEAPTGSGKTEAALAYASRLLAASMADGIIFALPTQATANAMLGRLEAAAGRLFQGGANLILAHGRAKYNADFMRLQMKRPPTAQEGEDASAQCSRWLASSRKIVFLGQIGVCTVDQVLLSVLPIRHHFLRSFGIHKSVLIVDEIHAYDNYMNGLLDEVLERQKRAGGSAILLSATLDSTRRRQILRRWDGGDGPGPRDGGHDPYPLVSRADGSGCRLQEVGARDPDRRVGLETRRSTGMRIGDVELAHLVQAAGDGARAALICNLVADAQDAARRLLAAGARVDLFHSRYRFCDRQTIEQQALRTYGKDSALAEGRILVATQVVEQSLDLDFDWMVTQLCPADLLFQRLGRLHRHDRTRPAAFRDPRCTVVVPESLDFGAHRHIYANLRALWRTQQLIERHGAAVFPAAYREWIEAVYGEEPWPEEPEEIIRAFDAFTQEEEAMRYCARQLVDSGMTNHNDTDGNVTALTRDGEMAVNVVPLVRGEERLRFLDGEAFAPEETGFDERLDRNSVPVPRSWAEALPADETRRRRLLMTPVGEDRWEAVAGGWSYDKRFGLERLKREPAA